MALLFRKQGYFVDSSLPVTRGLVVLLPAVDHRRIVTEEQGSRLRSSRKQPKASYTCCCQFCRIRLRVFTSLCFLQNAWICKVKPSSAQVWLIEAAIQDNLQFNRDVKSDGKITQPTTVSLLWISLDCEIHTHSFIPQCTLRQDNLSNLN